MRPPSGLCPSVLMCRLPDGRGALTIPPGILVPTLTPVAASGGVDEDTLRTHAEWLIARGVAGLYPCGSTGEGPRLSVEQRRTVVRVTCAAAAGRVPVLAGVWGWTPGERLAEAQHAASCGAAAIAATAPLYFRPGPEAIFRHFRDLAAASPVPVVVYNIPAFAVPVPVDVTVRLARECGNVVGIKDSSGDASDMARLAAGILPHRPDFGLLTGWDAALLPMLAAGATGGTHATANAAPALVNAVFDRFAAGDIEAARAAQRRLTTLFDVLIGAGEFPLGFRLAAEAAGALPPGRSRTGADVSECQRRTVAAALAAAGA